MAINPTRQQTRLAKSQEAGKAVIHEINVAKIQLKNIIDDLDQLQVRTTLEENAVTELNGQLMSISAVEVKTDETVADIARIGNEMKEHQERHNLAVQEYAAKRMERDEVEIKLAALMNGPTMLRIASQEKALARQEAAYPARLKRHLRKCRRHGWADARLGGKK